MICRISDKSSTLDAIKLPGKTDNLIKKMDAIIFLSLFFRSSDPNAVFTMNFLFPLRQTETSELFLVASELFLVVQHFGLSMVLLANNIAAFHHVVSAHVGDGGQTC